MKLFFSMILGFVCFGISGQEKYYLITEKTEMAYLSAISSEEFIEVDMETGLVSGKFLSQKFSAVYEVKGISSGFVKGFTYSMELGYLQRDYVRNDLFNSWTMQLARANRFYFYPDLLASPSWHFLEIKNGDTLLKFVRKHL